jgi:hypothetical protein
MNKKVRSILGGMTTAGLIAAGTIPFLAKTAYASTTCTRSKSKPVQTEKAKTAAPKEKKVEQKKADQKVVDKTPAKTVGTTKK